MLRQSLHLKLQQKLSPQQIQLVKLLEVPTLELGERILREIDENPALELGDDPSSMDSSDAPFDEEQENHSEDFLMDDYAPDDDIPDYRTQIQGHDSDENRKEKVLASAGNTLHEYVQEQMDLQSLPAELQPVARFIVGSIDDDGYLRRSAESLSDDIAIRLGIDSPAEQIQNIIRLIQGFDPPGVGAFDLRECLLLQLQHKKQTEPVKNATRLLDQYFDDFSKKHYDTITKRMECSMDELKAAIREITRLNPKPGSVYGASMEDSIDGVTPDFLLENSDGTLHLSLNNSSIPELHISADYIGMINDYHANTKNQTREARDAILFAKQKVDSAKWFIDAVRQRQETLMRTMQAIVDYQYNYFLDGDEKNLKPMILKDIAEKTGYDISTISRVSNSKYIQTTFGVFSLKYFFTEAMQTDSGEEVSVLEIKRILRENVDAENKNKPLTDEQLCDILASKGYVIARRTVAKYRDQLEIPIARLRRTL